MIQSDHLFPHDLLSKENLSLDLLITYRTSFVDEAKAKLAFSVERFVDRLC